MKKTVNNAVVVLVMIGLAAGAVPALAHSSPQFDITGVWQNSASQQLQILQEKDQINAIFINHGWAHRLEGRYVSPTRIKLVLIRRTRPNTCEMTMTADLTVVSANSLQVTSLAGETACGLTLGQTFVDKFTRML